MLAETGILHIVRIAEQGSPLALRILFLQFGQPGVGLVHVAFACIEQVEMIVNIVHVLKVWILVGKSAQVAFAQPQVVEFIFKDDAGVEEAVFQNLVAGCHLFFRKRNLGQIILPFMRVE